MTSSSARPTSRVEWVIQTVTVSGLTLAVARLKVRLHLARAAMGPRSLLLPAWLDTGAPVSVIPFHIQQKGLRWQSIPGIRAIWSGQRCDLGRIDVWLPIDQRDKPPMMQSPKLSTLAEREN